MLNLTTIYATERFSGLFHDCDENQVLDNFIEFPGCDRLGRVHFGQEAPRAHDFR